MSRAGVLQRVRVAAELVADAAELVGERLRRGAAAEQRGDPEQARLARVARGGAERRPRGRDKHSELAHPARLPEDAPFPSRSRRRSLSQEAHPLPPGWGRWST